MIDFYNKYGENLVYSQNKEEGIIIECLSRIKDVNKAAVEFGGHDGKWCSNTALLADEGWNVLFVEADFELWKKSCQNWEGKQNVRSQCSHVDPYNVNAFVKPETDVCSIDLDGTDYKVFKALKAKPKIVIIEIDSSIHPTEDKFNSEGGSGYKPMVELGIAKGYFLLCHTGNLVFVDDKYKNLFPEITADPLINHDLYFKRDWLKKVA